MNLETIAEVEMLESGHCRLVFRDMAENDRANRQTAEALKAQVDSIKSSYIILDLSELNHFSSQYLGIVCETAGHLKNQNRRYAVVVGGPSKKTMERVIDGLLEPCDSVQEAETRYNANT